MMVRAVCDSCGHAKLCYEEKYEVVNEKGKIVYENGHVCPECLKSAD